MTGVQIPSGALPFKSFSILKMFMAKVKTEVVNGIECRYVEAQDGIKVYLLPGVPMDAGDIPAERDFDLEEALEKVPITDKKRARRIAKMYKGRQIDTLSVLAYAEERGRFDEFAEILEAKPKDFAYIHPDLMMARTDVNAFFMQLLVDVGVAPKYEAERAKKLLEYGTGVVVLPKGRRIADYLKQ